MIIHFYFTGKKTPVKSKRILIDSSESEDESSAKKFKSNTSKLKEVEIFLNTR